VTTKFKDGLKQ